MIDTRFYVETIPRSFSIKFKLLINLIMVLLFLNGCASVEIADYKESVSNNKYLQNQDGLSVAIDPITDSAESKKYFGRDILSSGLLAVHILVDNRSSSCDYLFDKDKIVFKEAGISDIKEGNTLDEKMKADEQTAMSKQNVGLGGSVLITPIALPLYFSGLSDMRAINTIKHNMISKELRTKIVHSNEKIEGYIYFKIKNTDVLKDNNNQLNIPYMEMGSRKLDKFQFTF